jgi:transcriptional regulator with XRE-family HTH domain
METMERDPAYIALQVKFLRKMFQLTQENLAEAADLTTRTIEKVESGRHRPDEQTLRSLARALKPTPEQEARTHAEMQRALREMVLVPTNPIHTAVDFMNAFAQRHAFRFDTSDVDKEEALEIAASISDYIRDLDDIWDDSSMSQRLDYARSVAALCKEIERHGFVCYLGHHGQKLVERGKSTLVFDVGLMSIQRTEGPAGTRYALVQLEGALGVLGRSSSLPPEGATWPPS